VASTINGLARFIKTVGPRRAMVRAMMETSTKLTDPGGVFVDAQAYQDLDAWHRTAARIRREDPVHRVEIEGWMPLWAITRYEDVWDIERQPERFQNTMRSVLATNAFYEQQHALGLDIKALVQMDGAEHVAYRLVTNDWFKPSNLRRVAEADVRLLARQFVDRMMERGPCLDFAREIGWLFPLRVIMSIFGVPPEDEPLMLELTQKIFGSEDPEFAGGGDQVATLMSAIQGFYPYFDRLTADRRACPRSDVATVLANATIDGQPIGELERFSYYLLVASAGHDTTANAINGGLEVLCRHPDQLRFLQENPGAIDAACDEIVRYTTPVRHFLRHATEDSVLRGKTIAAGDAVLLSYLSASFDEAKFADPLRFDVTRSNAGEYLSFGTGVHFCLGVHLARMELKVFFRELIGRLETIELDGPTRASVSNFVGGVKHLPVRYRLRPAAEGSAAAGATA
jgi:cytochrome P450